MTMAKCKFCGEPVVSGIVAHDECLPRWIPVTERLPGVMTPVLVKNRYEEYEGVTIGYLFQPRDKRRKPYWEFFAYWMGDDMMHHAMGARMICPGNEYVTHWMPLPTPPEVTG